MHATSIKRRIIGYLSAGVPAARQALDARTGRFLAPNGGWAVTLQDVIFPLAALFTHPGTPYYEDEELLAMCRQGGNALRRAQNGDGQFEFVKIDGSRWGRTYMPWSIYHWLEAYALLRERLGARVRTRWEDGLSLAYDGLARTHTTPRGHNIPTWNGMSLFRAGQVFGREDWQDVGRRQVLFSSSHQHPDGYWPEGYGPTTGYNLVYVHAIGLYHCFSGDRTVLEPLRRAAHFHAVFTYPDGSSVEAVDGRMKYSPAVRTTGWPGLAVSAEGRRLVTRLAERLPRKGGLVPHLASALQHAMAGKPDSAPAKSAERTVFKRKALLKRKGPWFICVSGYAPSPEARPINSDKRWIMTRANCLSVWHGRSGLVVGGGNSKQDSRFATFEVWEHGAQRLEPDRVLFSRDANAERVTFIFGNARCRLHLEPIGPRLLKIGFEVPRGLPSDSVSAGFTMRAQADAQVCWGPPGAGAHRERLDPTRSIGTQWEPEAGNRGRCVQVGCWRVRMPPESRFDYPVYPFNPYAIDNAADASQAVATFRTGFTGNHAREFTLELVD